MKPSFVQSESLSGLHFSSEKFPDLKIADMTRYLGVLMILLAIINSSYVVAQDSSVITSNQLLLRYLSSVDKKTKAESAKINTQVISTIQAIKNEELSLYSKLAKINPKTAESIFGNIETRYDKLFSCWSNPAGGITENNWGSVSPSLDSLKNTVEFIRKSCGNASAKLKGLSNQFSDVTTQITQLGNKIKIADDFKQQIVQREQFLTEQFQQIGAAKMLRSYKQKVYYYKEQFSEFKEDLRDEKKIERKAFEVLNKIPSYKKFLQKNSYLSMIFGSVDDYNISAEKMEGLQTRAVVQTMLSDKMSAIGNTADLNVSQQFQSVPSIGTSLASQLERLRHQQEPEDKVYTPNSQHTKSFLKRFQFGADLQFGRTYNFLPMTSNIALSLGYKLNDKSTIGIGVAYMLGLGSGINDINLSSQGLGLRSFIDWKLLKNIYLSGGYEWNYLSAFHSIDQLKNLISWKQSGLIGISRKYKISPKIKGKVQLLFDFLSYKNLPKTPPIIFRMGWDF